MVEKIKKSFTGVWIPKHIIENKELSGVEKMIYAEIASFPVCYMTNESIATIAGCSEKTVTRGIKKLISMGFVELLKTDGRGRYVRALFDTPRPEKVTVLEPVGTLPSGETDFVETEVRLDKMSRGVDKMSMQGRQNVHQYNIDNKRIHIVAPHGDDLGKDKVSPPAESVPFDVKSWVTSLMESEQRHLRLIGYYFGKYADHNFPTKKVANDELKKNLKPASYLVENFSKEEITSTLRYCAKNFKDVHWNLATVKKQITYVTAQKE